MVGSWTFFHLADLCFARHRHIVSWTHSISLDLYKLPCLWDDKLIYVPSCTFHCKSARITLFALFPHPSSSMCRGTMVIDNFSWILGHLIALPIKCFPRFRNYKQHHVPCKPLFYHGYSWHSILYSFWSVKMCYMIQQL